MGPFDEIWHPAAQRARTEIQIQDERAAPAPFPGDPFAANRGHGGQPGIGVLQQQLDLSAPKLTVRLPEARKELPAVVDARLDGGRSR
jgi:hypothetical protein